MIILGLESTAHTFGCGIITSEGKILANVKDSFTSKDEGMIPEVVAKHHEQVADSIVTKALKDAKVTWKEIGYIAYSAGPGLDPCLWKGYHIAKELGVKHNKKLIGVNHCCAHLSIGKIYNKLKDPMYLYVSGVNTQIIFQEKGKYHIIGETLDIGLGNMLDKLGRIMNLGFPAGPIIELLAKKGSYLALPYTIKGMDVSFSGILTKVEQLWEKKITYKELLKNEGKSIETPYVADDNQQVIGMISRMNKALDEPIFKEDLCFSVQETCFAMLAEVVERAMANTGKQELLLVGGVGANKRFCEMLMIMCEERGATFYNVPQDLAGDQGAMIAYEGYLRKDQYGDVEVNPHWRADEV